jgi:hypothetical protein
MEGQGFDTRAGRGKVSPPAKSARVTSGASERRGDGVQLKVRKLPFVSSCPPAYSVIHGTGRLYVYVKKTGFFAA